MTLTGDPSQVNPGFKNPPDNPLMLLKEWLVTAERLAISEPRGLVLSTVNRQNQPSSRVVLLKALDEAGVIFGTSTSSAKALDLKQSAFVAGNLWWRETMQQISFQGKAQVMDRKTSQKLFSERGREAQATAIISSQSQLMENNEKILKSQIASLVDSDEALRCPDDWSAYHIKIHKIEFWLGSKTRFHQRLQYCLDEYEWVKSRLQP